MLSPVAKAFRGLASQKGKASSLAVRSLASFSTMSPPSSYRRARAPRQPNAQHRLASTFIEVEPSSTRSSSLVGKEEGNKEVPQRKSVSEVPIIEVLKDKMSQRWVEPVIQKNATLKEAIQAVIEGHLSAMMVVEINHETNSKQVVGLITSRDLLRIIAAFLKKGKDPGEFMDREVDDFKTPISQVLYARPDETVRMCRAIMAKLGIKCLPILSKEGRVEGIVTDRDMSEFGLTAEDKGGKKSFLRNISERVGLSKATSMADPPTYMHAHLAMEKLPLFVNMGVGELPHPFKSQGGAAGRREQRMQGPSSDTDLSEDAHFVASVNVPDANNGGLRDLTFFGVADGVGSWREYGVDPREFSHKLMDECKSIVMKAFNRTKEGEGKKLRDFPAPVEVLSQAYKRVRNQNVIGSSTACVAMFDNVRHQLHYSNLGDSGIIVLRHTDTSVSGSLKRESDQTGDLQVAFISQQQLIEFNHPYQLGWTGEEIDEDSSFKLPKDANVTSYQVRRGDVIIMATDGLFDNVDVTDVAKVVFKWEQECGFIKGTDIEARHERWASGESLTIASAEHVPQLAEELCALAREKSLDKTVDSPFAMLAKENDIMWSGGMPDDCTVIVAHVVGEAAESSTDTAL